MIDLSDKERQFGELYAITINSVWGRRERIVQLTRGFVDDESGVWFAFAIEPDTPIGDGRVLRFVDGPLCFEYWPEKCVGRVVGVIVPKWEQT